MGIEQEKLRSAMWEMKSAFARPVSRRCLELWRCGIMDDASSGRSDSVAPPTKAARALPSGL